MKDTDLFDLILYPYTLLELIISCRNFLLEFWELLMYTIISAANNDTLTSSFLTCIHMTSFCCLIALARNPCTVVNRYGESDNPVLSWILVGIHLISLHLIGGWLLVCDIFITLNMFSLVP